MDLDYILIAIPIVLYVGLAAAVKRVFFSTGSYATREWVVYTVPLVAWIGSMFIRSADFYAGLGNFLWEPLILASAPAAFWIIFWRRGRSPEGAVPQEYIESAVLVLIGVTVLLAFAQIPGIGDWS